MSDLPRHAVTRMARLARLPEASQAGPRWEPANAWAASQLSW